MKDWKQKEEIVKLLEQTISPSARVESNVLLPNLNSNIGAKCQCDVVVINGKPPRETISIVEVQDRASKVDINTFRGWCEKMRDVGAQHLICVSEKGFPDSVKEKAMKMGPTVRLLTLKQLKESERWPLDFFSNTIINPRRELAQIIEAKIDYENDENTGEEQLDINLDAPDFQYNGRWLSAKDLFFINLDYLESKGNFFEDGKHKINIKLPMDNHELNFRIGNKIKKIINFSATYEMDILNRRIQFDCSEYKQIEHEKSIAWFMEATVYLNDEQRAIKLIFVPEENKSYRLISRVI